MKNRSPILAASLCLGLALSILGSTAASARPIDKEDHRIQPTSTRMAKKTAGKNGIISTVYVEVNSNNILNAGSYKLKGTDTPFFDMAIIFAANINANEAKDGAKLHFNPNVSHILKNSGKYIRPLQDKSIKVTLSILGNHDGIGFANLTDPQIDQFVDQIDQAVNEYGLDGVDFDDEYAEYGKNGFPEGNSTSYAKLILKLRDKMPNKIITCYDIGYSGGFSNSFDGRQVGKALNYAWYAYYGSSKTDITISGLSRDKWGPHPLHINQSPYDPTSSATAIKNGGYGVNMMYDLKAKDSSSYISSVSQEIYGTGVEHNGEVFNKDW